MKTQKRVLIFGIVLGGFISGCGAPENFQIGQTSQSFNQNGVVVNTPLDILWVIDNSGSMAPLQANLTANFNSFISNFTAKGYDFRMAVTGTDAYKANTQFTGYSSSNDALSLFQDGGFTGTSPSGVFVIIPSTPNMDSVFVNNASTGINGSGDERAFSSMMTTLQNPLNPAFLRSNSFFAIIIVSDEDDFSNYSRTESSWGDNTALDHCYVNTAMDTASTTPYSGPNHVSTCADQTPPDTVASYEAALDTLTQSTGGGRRWNLSTIAVLDPTCQAAHAGTDPNGAPYVSVIGQRYMQMASDTNGITGSVCDTSYADSLEKISSQITTLSTQFFLNRLPQIPTLSVMVDGIFVPNDPTNGWTYNSANNSILFHGTSTPPQNATITVNFTPVAIGS
jgi:hypothetical protein